VDGRLCFPSRADYRIENFPLEIDRCEIYYGEGSELTFRDLSLMDDKISGKVSSIQTKELRALCGINPTLLQELVTGPYAALFLRFHRPKLPLAVASFFQTRTDIRRLSTAQEVANQILSLTDHTEMTGVRDIVARRELSRTIRYGKQQDHTAHTVYLYLLGLWLYDNIPVIRSSITSKYLEAERPSETKGELSWTHSVSWFLSQWSFGSLLHDVGYAFYNLDGDTISDREEIDKLYSVESVLGQYREEQLSVNGRRAWTEAFGKWSSEYGQAMHGGTAVCTEPNAILKQLSVAPWLRDFDARLRDSDTFDMLDPANIGLRDYACEVATEGYGGKNVCADHAVTSGLFLFQYSSFWPWLIKYVHDNNTCDVYKEIAGTSIMIRHS
jgi:hypothetical protein